MIAAQLLDRLDEVRQRGIGQWLARCPAHDDRSPSLSIKETEDGRVLIHCFALCNPADICAAAGIELSDLFPSDSHPDRGAKPYWNPRDLFLIVKHEVTVVEIAASKFPVWAQDDANRVRLAGQRIRTAMEVANVR